jgi:hypothetical protein
MPNSRRRSMRTIVLGVLVAMVVACGSEAVPYEGGGPGTLYRTDAGVGGPAATIDDEPEVPPDPAFDDETEDPIASPEETP